MNDKILLKCFSSGIDSLFLYVNCCNLFDQNIIDPTVMTVITITTHNIKSTDLINLKLLLFVFGIFLICNNILFKLF